MSCCRKKRNIPVYEMAFLTLCENTSLENDKKTKERLEKIWDFAEKENKAGKEIIMAGHSSGTSALHILSKNGNAAVLEWYLEKRKFYNAEFNHVSDILEYQPKINMKDTKGYTPIFLACWRGFKTRNNTSDEEKERIK